MLIFDLTLVSPGLKRARGCYHSHTMKLSVEPRDGYGAGALSFAGSMLCAWLSAILLNSRLRKHSQDFVIPTWWWCVSGIEVSQNSV